MLPVVYCGLIMSIFCFGKSLAISDDVREMTKMLHDSCVDESGVDEGLIDKANAGDFTEDNKLKCYMKCLMDEISAISDDGEIDVEVVISLLPDEIVAEAAPIVRDCGTVKGADACDSMYQTQKCYYSKNPEKYFLV